MCKLRNSSPNRAGSGQIYHLMQRIIKHFSAIYLFFFVISRTMTSQARSENSDQSGPLHPMLPNADRVRTHYSTSEAAARRLGRIIQRIFLPNQKAALVEPFGNGLVRVGSQGFFRLTCKPATLRCLARFISSRPSYFLSPQLTPWVSKDDSSQAH